MNLERHRKFIAIHNEGKPLSSLSTSELRIVRKETPSISEFLDAEAKLKRRGKIKSTFADKFTSMTGGKVIGG